MLNPSELAAYRRYRQQGVAAINALRTVLSETCDLPPVGESFVVEGFTVRIRIEQDQDADLSFLGEFTDRPAGDHSEGYCLRNPNAYDHGAYKWFVPANPVPEVAAELIKLKFGKRLAWELAWRYAKQDLQEALDYAPVGVIVTASREGIELGQDSLGGIDDPDYARSAVAEHDMIGTAIAKAKEMLGRLCTC